MNKQRACLLPLLFLGEIFFLSSCAHKPAQTSQGLLYSQRDASPAGIPTPSVEEKTQSSNPFPLLRYPYREASANPDKNQKALLDEEKDESKVLQTQPDRLDLTLSLAKTDRALGWFETQYALLARALQKIDQKEANFQWSPGQELPDSPAHLLSTALLESEAFYFNQGPDQTDKASRLARLAMTYNERDPYPYNALAVCHQIQGNSQHALKYLLIALNRDPQNCLVLGNIGRLLSSLGKKREARIYFKQVISLNRDPEETMEAKISLRIKPSAPAPEPVPH
jgi:tetratricopeptide (TPR) repeat protein